MSEGSAVYVVMRERVLLGWLVPALLCCTAKLKALPFDTALAGDAKDSQGQVQRQPQVSSTLTGDWLLGHEGLSPRSQLTR